MSTKDAELLGFGQGKEHVELAWIENAVVPTTAGGDVSGLNGHSGSYTIPNQPSPVTLQGKRW